MQLLFDSSEEKGLTEGLGWIPGSVKYMSPGDGLRVPHIGWNDLVLKKTNTVFDYLSTDRDFYFVHSLHAVCDEQFVIAEFEYGKSMVAAVQNDNVIGMQFHPEKSQQNGLKVFKQFFDWAECYLRGRDA
jgi:glutamine amidotransferase